MCLVTQSANRVIVARVACPRGDGISTLLSSSVGASRKIKAFLFPQPRDSSKTLNVAASANLTPAFYLRTPHSLFLHPLMLRPDAYFAANAVALHHELLRQRLDGRPDHLGVLRQLLHLGEARDYLERYPACTRSSFVDAEWERSQTRVREGLEWRVRGCDTMAAVI